MKITDAQHAALRWLYNAGNDDGLSYCRKHFGEPDVMKTGYEDNACEDGWDSDEAERDAA